MELRLLGPVQVHRAGETVSLGGDLSRTLFSMLVRRPGDVVATDTLIEALWGDDQPATARASLRMHASRLRRRLGPTDETGLDIIADGPGYRLVAERASIDFLRFEDLLQDARAASNELRLHDVVALVEQARRLWRGPAFADLDHASAVAIAQHLETERIAAEELLFETQLALGQSIEIIADLERAVRDHPERERLTGFLMTALYRAGRQCDALDAFQSLRTWLADELGLSPSPELVDIESAVLRQDQRLDPSPRPTPVPSPPAMVTRCPGLVGVVGSSGRSRVHRRGTRCTHRPPGADPRTRG